MVIIRGLFRTQISKIIFFGERLNSFRQKAPSQMFEKVPNVPMKMVTRTET